MKVVELIRQLSECNPDAEVFGGDDELAYSPITRIQKGVDMDGEFLTESDVWSTFYGFSDNEVVYALKHCPAVCLLVTVEA